MRQSAFRSVCAQLLGDCLRHILVAFGVWPVMVCPFNQGHTSSGVQVQGHEVEQVLGGDAQEL